MAMNKKTNIVRLQASATVNPRDWDTFSAMLAATKKIVAQQGNKVLVHECYNQSGSTSCLIVEAYIDEQAFLDHLELIRPLSAAYKVDWSISQLQLMGAFSQATVDSITSASVGTEVIFYREQL
jgi:hypothetical protein